MCERDRCGEKGILLHGFHECGEYRIVCRNAVHADRPSLCPHICKANAVHRYAAEMYEQRTQRQRFCGKRTQRFLALRDIPAQRGKGYAKQALHQAIAEASRHGIARLLVTCRSSNPASRRVILANGGTLEDIRDEMERYWIETK